MATPVQVVILAAGQGKRMYSDLPKVAHPLAGRALLAHVIESARALDPQRLCIVVGHGADDVRSRVPAPGAAWVMQEKQLGTGHAVMQAGPALAGFEGPLLVVCGDTPLLRAETLGKLIEGHKASGAAVTVLSMRLPDPTGYGRVVRGEGDRIAAIVEHRDATPEQKKIDEVNSGIYVFDYAALAGVLGRLSSHNEQGEFYLTDTVALLLRDGKKTAVVCADDFRELCGINTPEQLAEAERIYRQLEAQGGRS